MSTDRSNGMPNSVMCFENDNFRASFKKYKRRDKTLDLSDVVNLDTHGNTSSDFDSSVLIVQPVIPSLAAITGMKPVHDWQIFHFTQHKGFYLIRNPFLPGYQRYWVSCCMQDLPLPPNVTNLRVHPDIDPCTLWSTFVSQQNAGKAYDASSPLRKLRWTTIGYHYNWDTKEYKEENHTAFPEDIGMLSSYVAQTLGFNDFRAEAGIINYYHHDSTLAAHTDHSELDHEAPLISISFGQDAIFLMGGKTKATSPTAVMLHSGDICVMSGDARLAYHAVPRILHSASLAASGCFDAPADITQNIENQQAATLPTDLTYKDTNELEDGCSSVDCQKDLHKNGSQSQCVLSHALSDTFSYKSDQSSSDEKKPQSGESDCSPYPLETDHKCERLSDDKSKSHSACSADLIRDLNGKIVQTLQRQDWAPFATYLNSSRLNLNIRQVLKPGQSFPKPEQQDTDKVHSKKLRTEEPS